MVLPRRPRDNHGCDLTRRSGPKLGRNPPPGRTRSYTSGVPEIANPQLRGAVEHLITQVNPENVLAVRKVILDEVLRLQGVIDRYDKQSSWTATGPNAHANSSMCTPGAGFHVGRCSMDPISGPAAISFNRKIDAIVDNCKSYIRDLNAAGQKLAEVARAYAISEEQIESSFRSVSLP